MAMTDSQAAQKVQRDYKAKISSQSKKNFVLEKDVRYLDSRIALLIQNRMALEEVPGSSAWGVFKKLTLGSKMRLRVIWKMLRTFRKASFPTMIRHRNTATSSSSYSPNQGILLTFAVWSR